MSDYKSTGKYVERERRGSINEVQDNNTANADSAGIARRERERKATIFISSAQSLDHAYWNRCSSFFPSFSVGIRMAPMDGWIIR